jgi:hypothetical protein
VAGQVLLVVGGQLAGVILLPPHRQLGHIRHHPAAALLAFVDASERTAGALLSSDDYGSSVERTASVREAIRRGNRRWMFLGEEPSVIGEECY